MTRSKRRRLQRKLADQRRADGTFIQRKPASKFNGADVQDAFGHARAIPGRYQRLSMGDRSGAAWERIRR